MTFTQRVIEAIQQVPYGQVASYGDIARLAGSPRAARQVVRILHTQSKKENLPWHRIVNKAGQIVIKGSGNLLQKTMLEEEGVQVSEDGFIDMAVFGWKL